MFDPMGMLSGEQQQFLQEVQKFTKDINAVIKRDGKSITVLLNTTNTNAEQYLPRIQDAVINSLAQSLYMLFNIKGRIQ